MTVATTCRGCGADMAPDARFCGRCGGRPAGADAGSTDPARAQGPGTRVTPPGLVAGPTPRTAVPEPAVPPPAAPQRRWPAALVLVAVIGGLLVAQASREPVIEYDPRGFTARGEAGRSGVASLAPLPVPAETVWSIRRPSSSGHRAGFSTFAAGPSGVAVSAGGVVTFLRPDSGAVGWVHRGGRQVHAAVPGDGAVVVARPGTLTGLASGDGSVRWQRPADAHRLHALDGDVLAELPRDRIERVDPADGRTRWAVTVRDTLAASLRGVVAADRGGVDLLVSRPPGLVRGTPELPLTLAVVHLDATTGAPVWERELVGWQRELQEPPVAVHGDRLTMVTRETGRWETHVVERAAGTTSAAVESTPEDPAAVAGDTLVLPRDGGAVGVDAASGTERWRVPLGGRATTLTAIGDVVLLRSREQHVLVDAGSGDRLRTVSRSAVAVPELGGIVEPDGPALVARDAAGQTTWYGVPVVPELPAPAVHEDRIYLADQAGLTVLDPEDGAVVRTFGAPDGWSRGFDPPPTPAVADTAIVLSPPLFGGGGLIGLERVSAVLGWSREGDDPPAAGPLTLDGDVVYVPVGDEIHGYHTLSGRRSFAAVAQQPRGPVAIAGQYAVAATADQRAVTAGERVGEGVTVTPDVLAIHRPTRTTAWRTEVPACTPPAIDGGLVVVGTPEGVTGLELSTGEVVFEAAVGGACLAPVVADGRVVTVTGARTIAAVSATDGRVHWRRELPSPVTAAPALAGDEILAPTTDGILALALGDGAVAWAQGLDRGARSSPVVAGDRVVVRTLDGGLAAVAP